MLAANQRSDYTSPNAADHFHDNVWPPAHLCKSSSQDDDFEAVFTAYYRAMQCLAQLLMRLCALALGMPWHYFDSKIDRQISGLRLRNYPAPDSRLLPPKPGQQRVGAHSDFGALTILKADSDSLGGLQTQSVVDSTWSDVPWVAGKLLLA
eukprot:SAG31_NODE_352_length_17229_cov_9.658669_7_plen_151_part_00